MTLMNVGKKRVSGSITVLLAFVFLMILALVMTSLEAARTAALRACAQLALGAAVESMGADFYRPLFDEYGLFAIDLGFGSKTADAAKVTEHIEDYMIPNLEFGEVDNLTAVIIEMLTDCEGNAFMRQAVEAEQAVVTEYAVTELLERLGAVTEQADTIQLLERKTQVESKLALIDMATLRIMNLIDGVDVNVNKFFGRGRIYDISDMFVKSFMINEPNAANTSINNPELLDELKPYYRNPIQMAERLRSETKELAVLVAGREEALQGSDSQNSEQIGEFTKMVEAKTEICNSLSNTLADLCSGTLQCLTAAREEISDVNILRSELKSKVMEFEDFVLTVSSVADIDILGDFTDSLNEMKSYVGLADSGTTVDYAQMEKTLEHDISLLTEVGNVEIPMYSVNSSETEINRGLDTLTELELLFADYSYDGLSFDYSGLLTGSVQSNLADMAQSEISEALSEKVLEFLLPEGVKVSEAEIDTSLMPCLTKDSDSIDITDGTYDSGDTDSADNADGMTFSLSGITENSGLGALTSVLSACAENVYEKVMFTLYADDRFHCFTDDAKESQDRVLKYEQEYLVSGKESDSENLAAAAVQIALLRMIPAAIFTFTCDSTTEKASTVANATVGMLGVPFLTAAVRALILIVWAAEQAVVETAAVLAGRRVPVTTNAATFCISFAEIVTFSQDLIRTKVKSFDSSAMGLVYDDYLKMMILIRSRTSLSERALGLIQENIGYAYDEDFLICNCATGLEAKAEVISDTAYISLFPQLFDSQVMKGYGVVVRAVMEY